MFFRKTGVKITAAILCICFLTVSLFSGLLVILLLGSGSYDSTGSLYQTMAQHQLYRDTSLIMDEYFDPSEPTKPWVSYYQGGIYTGENTNFLYQIVDQETGQPVLQTCDGEPILLSQSHSYSYSVEQEIAAEEAQLEDNLFLCDGILYLYRSDVNAFVPQDVELSEAVTGILELDPAVMETGFSYENRHYTFNGSDFYLDETWNPSSVRHETRTYTITCYLIDGLPYPDVYRSLYSNAESIEAARYYLLVFFLVSLLLGIGLLSALGCAAGRVNGQTEPAIHPIFRLPTDVALFLCILAGALCLEMLVDISDSLMLTLAFDLVMLLCLAAVTVYGVLLLCVRGKTHTLISGSLIYWCIHNLGRFGRWLGRCGRKALGYLPLVWKVIVCYGVLCLAELIGLALFYWGDDFLYCIWFLEKLALGVLVGYVTLAFRRLKLGAESIAAGDYNTKVDETHLVLDFKDTANTLNHIQDGMNAAVESRMKSERLKSLITNVSHDLKTPLTSIISYVDLLKQEPAGSEAAAEYLGVLDRQSARLKKLVEDLVEASKASTGNIPMQKAPLDFNMLLRQALGEYTQRLENASLIPVLRAPEGSVMVLADGRLLWRVFDNLLGNIVKYAMPGTRVYLTVETGSSVTAVFRNISRDELDVSAEELMERFVRGDVSRHTEGSGLGLSIARSLTTSMGGSFDLSLDGDLFKAMVTFPLLPPEVAEPSASDSE